MNKNQLINDLKEARQAFMSSIDGLSDEQLRMPGAAGLWSVKDVMSHLTAWESEVVTAFNQVQNKTIPHILKIDDIYEFNDEQYHISAARTVEVVRDDFTQVHKMLLQMIEDFPQNDLFSRTKYKFMEGEPLAILVEDSAIEHEHEHAEDILTWRDSMGI